MVPSEAELLEESQLELIEDIGEATPDYDDDDDDDDVEKMLTLAERIFE